MHVCAHYSILVCPHFFEFVWNIVKCFKTIDVIYRLVIKTFKRFSLGRFLNFQKARLIDESRYWLVIVILQWYALCLASLVLYHFQAWVFGLQMPHPDVNSRKWSNWTLSDRTRCCGIFATGIPGPPEELCTLAFFICPALIISKDRWRAFNLLA